MVMTPPKAQLHIDPDTSAGRPPMVVVGAPGAQGETTVGTQGIGVRTPSAAAVAAATVGFAKLLHIANGGMFMPVAMSVMVDAGRPSMTTRVVGILTREVGANPKLHCSIAPVTTDCGIVLLFLRPLYGARE